MKSFMSITLATLFASVAFAAPQAGGSFMGFSMPPQCATGCITSEVQGAGCGTIPNIACVCKAEKVVAALKSCVPSKCKAEEIAKFEPTINTACKGVAGYPLKLAAKA
ncbi:hypothetical protein E2P81_ATG00588 [Venturia nashicola]|uniref:CFEM domain-containing protein n=1 Tax=Venturia nashicola TaxID=86259 RepID=A0A4Z1PFW1_9PEZI|nr:hypothetical protein E6O75_ATG00600 [Venturia nashicola]TLD39601.1 hypothetical protein E2P81_ATG00588 [Venturia nashicola]